MPGAQGRPEPPASPREWLVGVVKTSQTPSPAIVAKSPRAATDVSKFTKKTHTDEKWWVKSNGRESGGSSQLGEVKPTYLATEFRAVDEEWASVRGLRGEHGAIGTAQGRLPRLAST